MLLSVPRPRLIFYRLIAKGSEDKVLYTVKKYVYVCINELGSPLESPGTYPSIGNVRMKHRFLLRLTVMGTVSRSGTIKSVESEKRYECRKCKNIFSVYSEFETGNIIKPPLACLANQSQICESNKFMLVENSTKYNYCKEIKIQVSAQLLGVGAIPRSIRVILRNEYDSVKAGDDVIITGILTEKWAADLRDVRCDLEPVLVSRHVIRTNELKSEIRIPEDDIVVFEKFWEKFSESPLKGRKTRGESHLLLVGDPGTGKSQFLKFAAKLSNRAVISTELGSTSAGLTATAVKASGEWMLEAGALVLADGGLCCIDEFDSMREHDRFTIHEAMERQTISVAKAGNVTTLSTRTIVFGATNLKRQYDPSEPLFVNTTLSGPLMSRFDIVLVLLDKKNPEWDKVFSSHILVEEDSGKGKDAEDLTNIWSVTMLKRYFTYVKECFEPVLGKDAERVISSYCQLRRRLGFGDTARITVRLREMLIRLAEAHARLMFSNEVTQSDAITAILCIESSMTTSAIVDSVGNAMHFNFTENPDVEYPKHEKMILEKLGLL